MEETMWKRNKEGWKGGKKIGLMSKTWERCKSIGRRTSTSSSSPHRPVTTTRSRSWPSMSTHLDAGAMMKKKVAPDGCFSVYVGPQRERFMVKTEYANHHLFKMLLEEAESEYGYNSHGPLTLPCHVDFFSNVLAQIMLDDQERQRDGCAASFIMRKRSRSRSQYHLLTASP